MVAPLAVSRTDQSSSSRATLRTFSRDAPVHRVAGKDVPMPYAANLERMALPQADDVVQAVKAVCYV